MKINTPWEIHYWYKLTGILAIYLSAALALFKFTYLAYLYGILGALFIMTREDK